MGARTLKSILTAPLAIQLPINALGKAAEHGPSAWALTPV